MNCFLVYKGSLQKSIIGSVRQDAVAFMKANNERQGQVPSNLLASERISISQTEQIGDYICHEIHDISHGTCSGGGGAEI